MMEALGPSLAVDIGNSGIKVGRFSGGRLRLPVERLKRDDWAGIDRLATNHSAEFIIYSSVANVPSDDWIEHWKQRGHRAVYALTGPPFATDYRTTSTLGQDRIAAVAGALALTDGPRLVVDAGSCLTYDFVDADGRHRGGSIHPGVGMRLRAMHESTARLPSVSAEGELSLTGLTTEDALRTGGLLGTVAEMEGMLVRYRSDFPATSLLLTGGDAPLLLPHFSVPTVHFPHLVLQGLHHILQIYVHERI